jgi:hypothetical protein
MNVIYEVLSVILQSLQIIEYIIKIIGLIWPETS